MINNFSSWTQAWERTWVTRTTVLLDIILGSISVLGDETAIVLCWLILLEPVFNWAPTCIDFYPLLQDFNTSLYSQGPGIQTWPWVGDGWRASVYTIYCILNLYTYTDTDTTCTLLMHRHWSTIWYRRCWENTYSSTWLSWHHASVIKPPSPSFQGSWSHFITSQHMKLLSLPFYRFHGPFWQWNLRSWRAEAARATGQGSIHKHLKQETGVWQGTLVKGSKQLDCGHCTSIGFDATLWIWITVRDRLRNTHCTPLCKTLTRLSFTGMESHRPHACREGLQATAAPQTRDAGKTDGHFWMFTVSISHTWYIMSTTWLHDVTFIYAYIVYC